MTSFSRAEIIRSELCSGDLISNLKAILEQPTSYADAGLGTLGFFGYNSDQQLVLVSNQHVLLANQARIGAEIYAPAVHKNEWGLIEFEQDKLHPVARLADDGLLGNYTDSGKSYFVDCASAILLDAFQNEEFVRLLSQKISGVAKIKSEDLSGREPYVVKKVGGATGLTYGEVIEVTSPATPSGESRRHNVILIKPLKRFKHKTKPFAATGDSGAAVLNEKNELVGLLWGADKGGTGMGYASHIHPVLKQLKVAPILTNNTTQN